MIFSERAFDRWCITRRAWPAVLSIMMIPMTDPSKPSPTGPEVTKLAAKVAHELNNPLDAVLRFVSLAQRKVKSGDYADIDRHLSDAQFGLQRMVEIHRELMDIGRQTNDVLARQ